MDPSTRDGPPPVSFTTTSSPTTSSKPWPDGLNHSPMEATVVTPLATSPSGLSSSLLSPLDTPACSATNNQAHPAPRRSPSSNSLRDERRKSAPGLKKRSSTASLRPTSPRPSLSRRSSSSNFATSSPTTNNMSSRKLSEQIIPTASSIAAEYFQREVDLHQSADLQSKTLVIVHDACYGHRFSRPRTSKAALNSIVERPERIQASVLGVSAAYVRLARRHSRERFRPHPDTDLHQLPVPPFQIRKTARTMALSSPAVAHVHGTKWMDDLKTMCDAAESRLALNGKELVRPRSSGKDSASAKDPPFHEGDLYLCSESLNAFEGALGGVCEGVDAVFGPGSTKRTFVCIRPPGHHCSAGHPSGFCWINNVHVGISYAAMTHGLTHAAILDFDLHHGDGSQEIAWGQNQKAVTAAKNAANYKKTMIGYFSLHDINSYPCEMGEPEKVRNASVCIDGAHGQSIWNVHLEPWKSETEFWELYAARYALLIEKARAFLRMHTDRLASVGNGPSPKAAIFLSAGFDASEWEGAGMQRHQVNVPTNFYAKFTADVVRMAEEEGLGVDGRVISVLEGGYSNRALTSGVFSHLAGMGDVTASLGNVSEQQINRLAAEMTDRLGLSDTSQEDAMRTLSDTDYNSEWWSPASLEELESRVYPPPTPSTKSKSAPTYFAPTQSFTAKAVTTPRDRKSSGQASFESDPLPEVDWATAVHELSKVLIPSNRQITSCRPEELSAEASRLRRERQNAAKSRASAPSAVATPAMATPAVPEESRMKLRVRKPKSSLPSTPVETPRKQEPRSNRRTTIDPTSDLADSSLNNSPATRTARRKSTPSAAVSNKNSLADEVQSSPGTARPSSSASARRTSTSRTTPMSSASPKKLPPVPRVPSAFLSKLSAGGEEQPAPDESHTVSTNKENSPYADVDSLTADVQKLSIKLKVPSPEEHAAREKERRAAEERKKRSSKTPKSPRKPPGPRSSQTSTTSKLASRSSSALSRSQAPTIPSLLSTQASEVKHEVQEHAPSATLVSPVTSSSPTGSPTETELSLLSNVTINRPRWDKVLNVSAPAPSQEQSYTAMESSPPVSPGFLPDTIRSRSMVYTPPVTTAQAMNGLPVFMSSSPIPFASTSSTYGNENQPNSFAPVTPGQSNEYAVNGQSQNSERR